MGRGRRSAVAVGAILLPLSVAIAVDGSEQDGVRRAHLISGRVTDERGAPVEGAILQATVRGDAPAEDPPISFSKEDGAFEIACGAPGPYELTVMHDKLERATVQVEAPSEVRIVLGRGLVLDGTVLDADGDPVAGALVFTKGAVVRHTLESHETRTGERGEFSLAGLRPGPIVLSALVEGENGDPRLLATAHVTLPSAPVVLRFERGADISGTVVDLEGRPLPRVPVFARAAEYEELLSSAGSGLLRAEATSGDDGRFALRGLRDETYLVSAFDSDIKQVEPAPLEVRAGAQDVVIRVKRPSRRGSSKEEP